MYGPSNAFGFTGTGSIEKARFGMTKHLIAHSLAPVINMPDQEAWRDPYLCHSINLLIMKDGAVFNPAGRIRQETRIESRFISIQGVINCLIAIRVNRQCPAFTRAVHHHGV